MLLLLTNNGIDEKASLVGSCYNNGRPVLTSTSHASLVEWLLVLAEVTNVPRTGMAIVITEPFHGTIGDDDFNQVRGQFRSSAGPSYALIANPAEEQARAMLSEGVVVIPYSHPASGDDDHKQVDAFLARLARITLMADMTFEDAYLLQIGDKGMGSAGLGEPRPEVSDANWQLRRKGLISASGGSNQRLWLTEAGWERYWEIASKQNFGASTMVPARADRLTDAAILALTQLADHHPQPMPLSDLQPKEALDELNRQSLVAISGLYYGPHSHYERIRLNRFGLVVVNRLKQLGKMP